MTGSDVVEVFNALKDAGVDVWLDGGWAVDALLGKQTRPTRKTDTICGFSTNTSK